MTRPITEVIRDYRNGALVAMATDNLAEVTEAVRRTRKAGSVTIKLTLTPEAGRACATWAAAASRTTGSRGRTGLKRPLPH